MEQSSLNCWSQQLFSHPAPPALRTPRLYSVNPSGDIIYGVSFDVVVSAEGEGAMVRNISQFHVYSGKTLTYELDPVIPNEEMLKSIELYLLSDVIAVLLIYDREVYQFKQHVLFLNRKTKFADAIVTRTFTLQGVAHDTSVVLGQLSNGRILITGGHGPMDGERELTAVAVAADPMRAQRMEDVDLTPMVKEFASHLKEQDPSLRILASGIFWTEAGLSFLLVDQEKRLIRSGSLGSILKVPGGARNLCYIDRIQNSEEMIYDTALCPVDLKLCVQRGRQVWLLFCPPDYLKMMSWRWWLHMKLMPFYIRLIVWGLEFAVRMQTWGDGRKTLDCYLGLLNWMFGPTMIPTLTPDPIIDLYSLDLDSKILRPTSFKAPLSRSPHMGISFYHVIGECSRDGTLVMSRLPGGNKKKNMEIDVTLFPSPHRPPELARLATHSAFRNFPAFERSTRLRRFLGMIDYSWAL